MSVLETVWRELHRLEDRAVTVDEGSAAGFAALRVALWRHERAFRSVVQPLLVEDDTTRERALCARGELEALQAHLDDVQHSALGSERAADFEAVRTQLQRYLTETLPGLLGVSHDALAETDGAGLAKRYREAGRRNAPEHLRETEKTP